MPRFPDAVTRFCRYLFQLAMNPPRQDLVRADGSRIAAINENKVGRTGAYHFSPVEFLQVKSHDGVMLNASMIKPPNFNAQHKYPVLVFTYGGPHAQVVNRLGPAQHFSGIR